MDVVCIWCELVNYSLKTNFVAIYFLIKWIIHHNQFWNVNWLIELTERTMQLYNHYKICYLSMFIRVRDYWLTSYLNNFRAHRIECLCHQFKRSLRIDFDWESESKCAKVQVWCSKISKNYLRQKRWRYWETLLEIFV